MFQRVFASAVLDLLDHRGLLALTRLPQQRKFPQPQMPFGEIIRVKTQTLDVHTDCVVEVASLGYLCCAGKEGVSFLCVLSLSRLVHIRNLLTLIELQSNLISYRPLRPCQ